MRTGIVDETIPQGCFCISETYSWKDPETQHIVVGEFVGELSEYSDGETMRQNVRIEAYLIDLGGEAENGCYSAVIFRIGGTAVNTRRLLQIMRDGRAILKF